MHENEHEASVIRASDGRGAVVSLSTERDAQLADLIDSNADGMLVVDHAGRVRFANRAAERILRRSRADLVGRPFGAPVLDGEMTELDLPRGRIEHSVAEMRVSHVTWSGAPAHLVSLRDVTDRKWAELHLRVVYDISTVLSRAKTLSDGLELFLSIVCQAIGRRNAELWLAGSDGLTRTHVRGAVGTGPTGREMPRLVQLVWQRLQPRWVTDVRQEDVHLRFGWPPGQDTSAVAFLVGDRNRPLGVTVLYGATRMAEIPQLLGTLEAVGSHVGLFVERMRAEESRREGHELLRAIIDKTSDAITVKDAEGRYLVVSAAAAHQLGVPHDDLIGATDAVVRPEIASVIDGYDRAFLAGGPATVEEVLTIDGVERTFLTTRALHRHGDGTFLGLIRSSRDVTERNALADAVRHSNKMDAIGVLAGGIAHEFNNVLTAITVSAQLCRAALPLNSEVEEDLGQILAAADRAADLTRQLLAFGRRQLLHPKAVVVGELLARVAPDLERVLGERVRLVRKAPSNVWRVNIDATQLERVLGTLAAAAKDSMPEGGTLTIEACNVEVDDNVARAHRPMTTGAYVRISVSDDGAGMDPETRERIFEPFFAARDPGRSAGLGLAVVYGIVKQSGGYIWVKSERGEGTTFDIMLPRLAPEPNAVTERVESSAAPVGRETLLVVEDEAVIRNALCRILERDGYRVLRAANGLEALAAFRTSPTHVDLLVSDVVMPGMTGPEVYEALKKSDETLPVLFMSGYTSGTVGIEGIIEGSVPFIEKPFTSEGVLEKVRSILDARIAAHRSSRA